MKADDMSLKMTIITNIQTMLKKANMAEIPFDSLWRLSYGALSTIQDDLLPRYNEAIKRR